MSDRLEATGDFSFIRDPKRHEPEGDPCQWCGSPLAEHTGKVIVTVSACGGGGGGGPPVIEAAAAAPTVIETDWATFKGPGIPVTVGGGK